jgi:hypothetical protein
VRAAGGMVDPLAPSGDLVPLSFRTDGRWIWQDALAHYLRTRGVAPELEFLCHIEEQGYVPPLVPTEVVPVAGAVVKQGPPPRLAKPSVAYYLEPLGGLGRAIAGEHDTLRPDLRWGRASFGEVRQRLEAPQYREISEEAAVRFVDGRWSAGASVAPMD